MTTQISAIIITLNEEKNIKDVIESVQNVCDEVLIIDSESTDRTVEIAEALGARVVIQKYLGDGPQKAFGEPLAKNDWIFSIDADERLESAEKAILELDLKSTPFDGFSFRRKTFVGNHLIKSWYPDRVLRLYNRKTAYRTKDMGHAYVKAENPKNLNADLLHFSYASYKDMIRGVEKFSSRDAKILFEKGQRTGYFGVLSHSAAALFREMIIRRGLFYGIHSWNIALISVFYTFMKYVLLMEIQEKSKK